MLPSVVMTMPMVECSRITRVVPSSAASAIVTGWSAHGVVTMRGLSPSSCPAAPGTMYPTQSMSRTEQLAPSSSAMSTASSGTNFGSEVITVRPLPLCGSSSLARSRR